MSPSRTFPLFLASSAPLGRRSLRSLLRRTLTSAWLVAWVLATLWSEPGRCEPGSSASWAELARLQRQALRRSELDRRSQRDVESRLRLSALLPQLRVTWGRGTQWVYSTRSDLIGEPVPDGDRSNYSVSLSWDLARLLWSPEDLTLHRVAPRMASERRQILLQVATLYLRLCQRQNHLAASPAPAHTDGQAAVLQIALQALLGEEAHSRSAAHCPASMPDPASLSTLAAERSPAALDPSPGAAVPLPTLPEP